MEKDSTPAPPPLHVMLPQLIECTLNTEHERNPDVLHAYAKKANKCLIYSALVNLKLFVFVCEIKVNIKTKRKGENMDSLFCLI